MFHKLLVAIDRSAMSRCAFDEALRIAKAMGASITLLHVLSLEDEESPHVPSVLGHDFYPRGSGRSVLQIYEDLWHGYEVRGLTLLRSLADEAVSQGIPTEILQNVGNPGFMICKVAHMLDIDLIILGRQGCHGRLYEWLLGSVSNYVVHKAPCSVLVTHRPSEIIAEPIANQSTTTA